jgi:hypothetical protein
LTPGRIYEVWKGTSRVWEGILDEPVPDTTGWSITAHGNGTYGNSYMAYYPINVSNGCGSESGSSTIASGTYSPTQADVGSIITGNFIPTNVIVMVGSVIGSGPGNSFTMVNAIGGGAVNATGTSTSATGNGACDVTFTQWSLDQVLNQAISRGMRWTKPTFGNQGWMQTLEDSASITTTDFLNNATIQAGLLWYVDVHQNNLLQIAAPPTEVNRLIVCQVPNPRSLAAGLNRLWYKYVASVNGSTQTYAYGSVTPDAADGGSQSQNQFGGLEQYVDMTANNAEVMTSAQAQSNAQNILNQYVTAMYATTYTVRAGQLLTTGGSPVDPASEPAGNVYRLLLTDGSYGGDVVAGPVTFVGGEVEWDDDSLTAQITPYQSYKSDLQTLLTADMPALRM